MAFETRRAAFLAFIGNENSGYTNFVTQKQKLAKHVNTARNLNLTPQIFSLQLAIDRFEFMWFYLTRDILELERISRLVYVRWLKIDQMNLYLKLDRSAAKNESL